MVGVTTGGATAGSPHVPDLRAFIDYKTSLTTH